jgi:hypothetical protein
MLDPFFHEAADDDVGAIEFHVVFLSQPVPALQLAGNSLRRDGRDNMIRRFVAHGTTPPGHLVEPARTR